MEMRYEIRYNVVSVSKLKEEYAELVNKAVAALSGSHSKYSDFCVGAAVLLENKKHNQFGRKQLNNTCNALK